MIQILNFLQKISTSLDVLAQQASKPFYYTQEFWTVIAIIVAFSTPFILHRLSNKPKKSRLEFCGKSVVNQDTASNEEESNMNRLLHVGRIIIKNTGRFKASAVEAYIEKIFSDDEERKDFFPIPLIWTHGQLNKNGPAVRDIYPNQTVYLDLFNHIFNNDYINNNIVVFAVAAGGHVENLSRVNLGMSEVVIKIYQESGQVDQVRVRINWNGKSAPELSLIQ